MVPPRRAHCPPGSSQPSKPGCHRPPTLHGLQRLRFHHRLPHTSTPLTCPLVPSGSDHFMPKEISAIMMRDHRHVQTSSYGKALKPLAPLVWVGNASPGSPVPAELGVACPAGLGASGVSGRRGSPAQRLSWLSWAAVWGQLQPGDRSHGFSASRCPGRQAHMQGHHSPREGLGQTH